VPYLILEALCIFFGSLVIIGSGAYVFIYSPALGATVLVIGELIVGKNIIKLWKIKYKYIVLPICRRLFPPEVSN
jgi:hypothetical protein